MSWTIRRQNTYSDAFLVLACWGGLFGAVLVLVLGLYFVVAGIFPASSLPDLLIPVAGAFIVFFLVSLDWLLKWFLGERLGGRVGGWQIMPVWLKHLTDYLNEDNGPSSPH